MIKSEWDRPILQRIGGGWGLGMDGQCPLSLPREGESVGNEYLCCACPSQPSLGLGRAGAWAWMVNAGFPSPGRVKAFLIRKHVQGEVGPSQPIKVNGAG